MPSEPEDACGYITNTQLVQGNIALVKRGLVATLLLLLLLKFFIKGR